MPQHALDYRRLRPAHLGTLGLAPGYETTGRQPGGMPDAGMLARHEHRSRQQAEGSGGVAALDLRRRQLELERLRYGG